MPRQLSLPCDELELNKILSNRSTPFQGSLLHKHENTLRIIH